MSGNKTERPDEGRRRPEDGEKENGRTEQPQPKFYRFGANTIIQQGCQLHGTEEMSIGNGVFVRTGCWFNVVTKVTGERPKIIIGDGCQFNKGVSISAANRIVLERFSLYGSNTFIVDTQHEYRRIGIPVLYQGITETNGETVVGEGAWIGANCLISGGVRIGKGSVIGANSVVIRNIPDYSVAVGAPAKVIKMFDTAAADWIDVRGPDEVEAVLRRRRKQPVLSICIPTYNRASDLRRCLDSIFAQIGDCSLIEVCVSDNASPDGTPEVTAEFAARYPNFRHWRNGSNIGAERNILKLLDEARGMYVKLQGDDDFFVDLTVLPLMNIAHTHRNCPVIFIDVLSDSRQVETFEGLDAFLQQASVAAGFLSSVMIRRESYEQIGDKTKFIGTGFNHIYLQYELLRQNPRFCVVRSPIFNYADNPPSGYNFAQYFIAGYLSILRHFEPYGLSADAIRQEKARMLQTTVLPWYKRIVDERLGTDLTGFEEIFIEHYKDEPYCDSVLNWLRSVRQGPS
ncbi:glycosyltransferase [Paenibacillus thermoaerophilus]|uniref:Glycosyltransferase n=1 Tax=Paenibacillus thermoaerophilus TaxID=1215385 RepID=A0ABW2V6P7_9BACL|nr:glycosyltransferase [Paenibacillus thermoaerophilus]TMV07355.1 glycosyltransferase [Paenibacillus thermoaerophilus]